MQRAEGWIAGARRGGLDTPWTLALIGIAFAAVSVASQQPVWAAIASNPFFPFFQSLPAAVPCWAAALVALVLAARLTPETARRAFQGAAAALEGKRATVLLIALAVLAPLLIAYAVLDGFPNSGDEYAYLFQAMQFAKGRLWAAAPPLGYSFVPYRTWIAGGKWLSQYPPGWPAALAVPLLLHLPAWALNAVLGAASVAALTARSWRFADRRLAMIAAGLYVLTPFYLFTASSFHSHMLSALLIVLLCLCCRQHQQTGRIAPLVAAGVLLGLIGMTRYFTLILLVPALLYWVAVEVKSRRFRAVAVPLLCGLPFLALLMAYQHLALGSAFRSSYAVITEKDTFLSLSSGSLEVGAVATFFRLAGLALWTSPVLPLVYAVCLWIKLRQRSLTFYDLIFPSFVLGFVCFADLGGNRYGPRYYFEAFPLMLATVASALPLALAGAKRLSPRWPILEPALLVAALYLLTAWPAAFMAYHQQVVTRQEPYRLAAARGLANAIVIIRESSGRGLSAADLARNGDTLDAPVLYARAEATVSEPVATVAALRHAFPRRSIWVYEHESPSQPGRLVPVAP